MSPAKTRFAAIAGSWLAATLVCGASARAQTPDSLGVPPGRLVDSTAVADSLARLDRTAPRPPLSPEVVTRLARLTTASTDTPGGMGLIATGLSEAAIASDYAAMAGRDSNWLGNMTANMANVIHAIDPSQARGGPGLGYGYKRAAEGVRREAAAASASGDVPNDVQFHLMFVERAAAGAIDRADAAIMLARRVQRAPDAQTGNRLVRELVHVVRAMAYGDDRDGDGRIGHDEAESGLAQAMYHLKLIYRVEGLPFPAGW